MPLLGKQQQLRELYVLGEFSSNCGPQYVLSDAVPVTSHLLAVVFCEFPGVFGACIADELSDLEVVEFGSLVVILN